MTVCATCNLLLKISPATRLMRETMNEKLVAYIVSFVVMAACCFGVPALLFFLSGLGLFAWFADNSIALALIGAAGYLLHRDRRKRRQALGRRERAVAFAPLALAEGAAIRSEGVRRVVAIGRGWHALASVRVRAGRSR